MARRRGSAAAPAEPPVAVAAPAEVEAVPAPAAARAAAGAAAAPVGAVARRVGAAAPAAAVARVPRDRSATRRWAGACATRLLVRTAAASRTAPAWHLPASRWARAAR